MAGTTTDGGSHEHVPVPVVSRRSLLRWIPALPFLGSVLGRTLTAPAVTGSIVWAGASQRLANGMERCTRQAWLCLSNGQRKLIEDVEWFVNGRSVSSARWLVNRWREVPRSIVDHEAVWRRK